MIKLPKISKNTTKKTYTFPESYTIPEDRIPKAWSQGLYGCCVAASITKVLEVINYRRTGEYVMLSKGFTYGRHSPAYKKQAGMDYDFTIPRLLEIGTVPESMCPIMDELPDIREKINSLPNLAELDKEAAKTRIKSFTHIKGNIHFKNEVKQCLFDHKMPLVANCVGKRHCVVIVGYEGNQFKFVEHNGRDTIYKSKQGFNTAYYLDGGFDDDSFNIDQQKEYTETAEIVDRLVDIGLITNKEMWLTKADQKNDINVYWLCRKFANYTFATTRRDTEITDTPTIVKELVNAGIITNKEMWLTKADQKNDINVYWLCRKLANRIRGAI